MQMRSFVTECLLAHYGYGIAFSGGTHGCSLLMDGRCKGSPGLVI